MILYHSTFKPLLESIKEHGLGADVKVRNIDYSYPDLTYLSPDKEFVEKFARMSVARSTNKYTKDDIVILSVESDLLNQVNLKNNNVPYVTDEEKEKIYTYKGIIPSNLLIIEMREQDRGKPINLYGRRSL